MHIYQGLAEQTSHVYMINITKTVNEFTESMNLSLI
jgi:hypothetical protein